MMLKLNDLPFLGKIKAICRS
jgi:hypothetical protein